MFLHMIMSMSLEQFLIVALTFLLPPVSILVLIIILLATFGKSLGIRRAYVKGLLEIFQWVSSRIECAELESMSTQVDDADLITDQPYERRRTPSGKNLIHKDASTRVMEKITTPEPDKSKVMTFVEDSLDFLKAGAEAIIDDEVTSRFSAEELTTWNLLTRTSLGHQYVSLRLTVMWCIGFVFRYFILFPIRMIIFFIGLIFLIICTAVVGYWPNGERKRRLNHHISLMSYRILCRSLSTIITYHNEQNMAMPGGICVANHTSPIDVVILSCGNCYALVGQSHGGILGVIQRALSRASSHIWFQRSEVNDRLAVSRRLREHVEDQSKLPILIFPEGTCINNTSVMMFKKGCFEVGGVIYPAAIKYDARFGDAFWNSSKQTYFEYLIMMMTSWAIVVDVYYLPPMVRQENEPGIEFAARVKKAIAEAGGLVELEWDGQLKRYPVKKEMLEKQRERYSKRMKGSGVNLEEAIIAASNKSIAQNGNSAATKQSCASMTSG